MEGQMYWWRNAKSSEEKIGFTTNAKTSFNLFISLRIERNILVDLLANDSLSKHLLSPYNGVFDRHRRYRSSQASVRHSVLAQRWPNARLSALPNSNFYITAQDLP